MQADRRPLAQQPVEQVDQPAGVEVLEGRQERLPPVQQQHQVREPVGGRGGGALLGQIGEPRGGQQRLPTADLGGQPGQQPAQPLGLVAGHDRAGVWQRGQRAEPAAARVERVEVHVVRAGCLGERGGQRAQRGRAPGARRAQHHEVGRAVEVEQQWPSGLLARHVHDAVRRGRDPAGHCCQRVLAGRQVAGDDERGQRRQPRRALRRQAEVGGRPDAGVDEQREVGDVLLALGAGAAAGERVAELGGRQQLDDGRLIAGDDGRPAPADATGLERGEVGVAGPGVGAAGGGPADGRGQRRLDDVARLGGAGDRKAQPQVGVGADVGRHHALRALGGQHQVDTERPAAHRDADQTAHEVGQFLHQRGELVDDDH